MSVEVPWKIRFPLHARRTALRLKPKTRWLLWRQRCPSTVLPTPPRIPVLCSDATGPVSSLEPDPRPGMTALRDWQNVTNRHSEIDSESLVRGFWLQPRTKNRFLIWRTENGSTVNQSLCSFEPATCYPQPRSSSLTTHNLELATDLLLFPTPYPLPPTPLWFPIPHR